MQVNSVYEGAYRNVLACVGCQCGQDKLLLWVWDGTVPVEAFWSQETSLMEK